MAIRLEMNNMVVAGKQRKYQHYHQVKLINKNILLVKKYYLPVKVKL